MFASETDVDTIIERMTALNYELDQQLERTLRRQGRSLPQFFALRHRVASVPAETRRRVEAQLQRQLPASSINWRQFLAPKLARPTSGVRLVRG